MALNAGHFWKDRLDIPAYRVGEAASYAHLSPQTVAAWHKKKAQSDHAVLSQREGGKGLSFLQLIELAVAAEMRRLGVRLPEIERARKYFRDSTGLEYPFAQLKFKTDGADVFSEIEGPLGIVVEDKLIAANYGGQFVWTEMLSSKFEEFNYDDSGAVVAWRVAGKDKPITIDPKLAFGAPQVHGIKTGTIKSRFASGEEVDEIADDFGVPVPDVIEALLFEGLEPSEDRIRRWMN